MFGVAPECQTLKKHIRSIFTKLGRDEIADENRRVLAVVARLRSA